MASSSPARRDGDRIVIRLHCPRGNGQAGCRGSLTVQLRRKRGGRLLDGGSAAFAIPSGEGEMVGIQAGGRLRKALSRQPKVKLRITAATRSEDGAIRLTHAKRVLGE